MKKLTALLIAGILLISLAACGGGASNGGGNSGNGASGGVGVDLKLDFTHMNDKTYEAHTAIGAKDEVSESEPEFIRIENAEANYVLDLTLDAEAKEGYAQFQKTAKEENDFYKEVSFGAYKGYCSSAEEGDIYGYILMDESDPTFNVFVMFDLYLYDDSTGDIQKIYESDAIQSILNGFAFKSAK